MELVPILSMIVLVGTIATFILAVFAYILYKVRERRARETAVRRKPADDEARSGEGEASRAGWMRPPAVEIVRQRAAADDLGDESAAADATSADGGSATANPPPDPNGTPPGAPRQDSEERAQSGSTRTAADFERTESTQGAVQQERRVPPDDARNQQLPSPQLNASKPEHNLAPQDVPADEVEVTPQRWLVEDADAPTHEPTRPPMAPLVDTAVPIPGLEWQSASSPAEARRIVFWEYTGQGFVPVDPADAPPPPPAARRNRSAARDDQSGDWL